MRLTGHYAEVANAPLTTIDLNVADMASGQAAVTLVDTPGIYDMFNGSDDFEIIRGALVSPRPDGVLFCLDANRLKQSLALLLEVSTLGLPMVCSLNMFDEASRTGMRLDVKRLERMIGTPVVSINGDPQSALQVAALLCEATPSTPADVRQTRSISEALQAIESGLPDCVEYPRAAAHYLLMGGESLCRFGASGDVGGGEKLKGSLAETKGRIRGNPGVKLKAAWNSWVDACFRHVVTTPARKGNNTLARLGHYSRSPVTGPFVLIMILYVTFKLVVDFANGISEAMNTHLWAPVQAYLAGILPQGFWSDLLIGDYGLLSMGVANALLTVVPILSVFYLIFNTLEEAGYLPNLSVLTRRLLAMLGLGSSAIMPLILGFGCKTMATLTTKTMTSQRERFITIFLIAFAIPCAGQMGLNMSIVGRMGWGAFVISSVWLLFVELTAGLTLNRFLKQTEKLDPFILQLPPIRVPSPIMVLRKTYLKVSNFIKESLGVFVLAALFLFTVDAVGVLDSLKQWMEPVLSHVLGLPPSMVDALILLLARHEAAAALIIDLIRKGQLDYTQSIVAVTLTTMFAPCFANVMAMTKVLGVREAGLIFVAVNIAAIASSAALNVIVRAFGG